MPSTASEYVAELNRRSPRGFDPSVGPPRCRTRFAHGGPHRVAAVLVEALSLYRSAGWVEVPAFNDEPFADHWLEKVLP
jgi:hypothetical protein